MSNNCDTCRYLLKKGWEEPCNDCLYCNRWEPATNADRIRAMTDEELAKEVENVACPPNMRNKSCVGKNCYECWIEWLQQPCGGADNE